VSVLGEPVDGRANLYSLECVLFEMLVVGHRSKARWRPSRTHTCTDRHRGRGLDALLD